MPFDRESLKKIAKNIGANLVPWGIPLREKRGKIRNPQYYNVAAAEIKKKKKTLQDILKKLVRVDAIEGE